MTEQMFRKLLFFALLFVAPRTYAEDSATYEVLLLGDTHYDGGAYHDPDATAKLIKVQRNELERNAAMWKKDSPQMLHAAASKVNDTP